MNKFVFIILICSISIGIYSKDLPEVRIDKIKLEENYDLLYYGARIEPEYLYKQYSPITGIVSQVFVNEGSYVKKDQPVLSITRKSTGGIVYNPMIIKAISNGILINRNTFTGLEILEKTELFSIALSSRLLLKILVSDQDIKSIKIGDTCTVKGNEKIAGKISKISVIPDGKIGLFEVEIIFDNKNDLFIGNYIIVEIKVNYFKGITIPRNNVTNRYGKTFLYIVKNNKVKLQEIKVGKSYGKNLIIEGNINPGDEYVIYASMVLNDGDEVIIKREGNNVNNREDNRRF